MNEESLFHLAREKHPQERAAFLNEACAGDSELRRRVEVLLRAHEDPASLLDRPILERAAVPVTEAATLAPGERQSTSLAPGTHVRYFGDYEVIEEIARGGMGVVYKARQVSLNRTVALKMILAGQLASEADVQRFHREAEAAANLDHSNIVPIYEIGQHEGQHYFSMKLIDGTSLAHRAAGFVRDPRAAVKIMVKVARAVHDAHQHGILHRDLKPSNILLDSHGEPFVGDFGLARHIDGRGPQTQSGLIVGTPSYMAPEQARSEKALTTAVDVYGLGAILYELLTGRPPFRAETELDTILQVLDREPPPPRSLNPLIDRDLETICLKCLEKEQRKRYGSALALAEDLERWQAGQTIQARPSGPAKKVLKWTKRNPALAILLVVLGLWYFNVRLPWQWAWLDWALNGGLILLGVSRLVVLGRRVIGRPAKTPLELSLDAFLLPGAVLAMIVLLFYHGDLAERKSLAFSIVSIFLWWGTVIGWLWRRRQAGRLSVAVRFPLPMALVLGFCGALFFVSQVPYLFEEMGDSLVKVSSAISSISLFVFVFLMVAAGTEIREQGIVTFFGFVRWDEIASYSWKYAKEALFLQFKRRNSPVPIQQVTNPARKDIVDRILKEYLPQGEQGIVTGIDESELVGLSDPARQVRDPASLLMYCGFMQIVGTLCFTGVFGLALFVNPAFVADFGSFWIPFLVLILLTSAGVSTGAIVFIGARRMRKLQDYRFCRMACIVAMLPLSYVFPFGLPVGIWALRVLNRPEVKAAFAPNDIASC